MSDKVDLYIFKVPQFSQFLASAFVVRQREGDNALVEVMEVREHHLRAALEGVYALGVCIRLLFGKESASTIQITGGM